MSDPHEDRAAMEAAWDALTRRFMVEWPTDQQAFGAGWQARGAYEAQRAEGLRAAAELAFQALLWRGPGDLDLNQVVAALGALRAAGVEPRVALASVPVATGEGGEDDHGKD